MEGNQKDLISVIIPVYNTEKYLPECLDSVLASTYPNLEVICVNDASTDGSLEILKRYAEKDKRIRIIDCGRNGGQASTRNQALDIAQGKYLAFVDSDDDVDRTIFEELYRQCISEGSDVSACGFMETDETTGEQRKEILETGHSPLTEREWWESYRHKHTVFMNCVWNKLYKSECFRGKRFVPGVIYEDTNLQHKLLQGKTISVSAQALYYYRRRENSTTKVIHSERSFFRIQSLIDRAEYFESQEWSRAKIPALQDAIKFIYQATYRSDMDRKKAKAIGKKYRSKIKSMMSITDWCRIRQKFQCLMILYVPDLYNSLRTLGKGY